MRIADFPMVRRMVEARAALVAQIGSPTLQVSIGCKPQDSEMNEAVRPIVEDVLRARVRELDKDLEQLGVKVD